MWSLRWLCVVTLCFLFPSCLTYFSTLKIEAVCSPETSTIFYQTTRHHPENFTLPNHFLENLRHDVIKKLSHNNTVESEDSPVHLSIGGMSWGTLPDSCMNFLPYRLQYRFLPSRQPWVTNLKNSRQYLSKTYDFYDKDIVYMANIKILILYTNAIDMLIMFQEVTNKTFNRKILCKLDNITSHK